MTHKFFDLPYGYDALEPHIDAMTMEIHHSKHHRTYYDKMEAALANTEAMAMDIDRLLAQVARLGPAVRNNAGGYYNHNLFWQCMSPDGGGEPSGALAHEIDRTFKSADELKKEVADCGVARFGSGFAWLVVQNRKLKVVSTPNQDNPLMTDVVPEEVAGTPILALDVWEHAYYLKYQNRRPDYIRAFWDVVDWKKTGERFEAAMDASSS